VNDDLTHSEENFNLKRKVIPRRAVCFLTYEHTSNPSIHPIQPSIASAQKNESNQWPGEGTSAEARAATAATHRVHPGK
jgi:hypothetical protein